MWDRSQGSGDYIGYDTTRVTPDPVLPRASRSLCPECGQVIGCTLSEVDEQVVMDKGCPVHGSYRTVVSTDAEHYVASARHERPGKEHLVRKGVVDRGCPHDCGMCPEHRQHSCVGVIEVTEVLPDGRMVPFCVSNNLSRPAAGDGGC